MKHTNVLQRRHLRQVEIIQELLAFLPVFPVLLVMVRQDALMISLQRANQGPIQDFLAQRPLLFRNPRIFPDLLHGLKRQVNRGHAEFDIMQRLLRRHWRSLGTIVPAGLQML